MHKSRKIKMKEYEMKYGNIPVDFKQRIEYMIDMYNLSEKKMDEIIYKRNLMMTQMQYYDFKVLLLEEPEGTPRPRFRIVNKQNFANAAMNNGQFVHVYSLNAKDDSMYMKRLLGNELYSLDQLIYTPCVIEYNMYFKTPSSYNIDDKFLAEIGLIRCTKKPDWDNCGKKYCDMYNSNVWVDDSSVVSATVNKFYSIKPRVEINLRYLNMLYNKKEYDSISKKTDQECIYFHG